MTNAHKRLAKRFGIENGILNVVPGFVNWVKKDKITLKLHEAMELIREYEELKK